MATVRLRTAAIVAFSVVGLCLMAMDCGDDAQVEFGISYSWPQWAPQWTPDGFEVVAGLTASYLVVPADGSRMQEVAKGGDRFKNVLSASISPDGSRLVYATLRHRTKGWRNYELGSSALDGSDYNRLTETEAFESNPVWSPDGLELHSCPTVWPTRTLVTITMGVRSPSSRWHRTGRMCVLWHPMSLH